MYKPNLSILLVSTQYIQCDAYRILPRSYIQYLKLEYNIIETKINNSISSPTYKVLILTSLKRISLNRLIFSRRSP